MASTRPEARLLGLKDEVIGIQATIMTLNKGMRNLSEIKAMVASLVREAVTEETEIIWSEGVCIRVIGA